MTHRKTKVKEDGLQKDQTLLPLPMVQKIPTVDGRF